MSSLSTDNPSANPTSQTWGWGAEKKRAKCLKRMFVLEVGFSVSDAETQGLGYPPLNLGSINRVK